MQCFQLWYLSYIPKTYPLNQKRPLANELGSFPVRLRYTVVPVLLSRSLSPCCNISCANSAMFVHRLVPRCAIVKIKRNHVSEPKLQTPHEMNTGQNIFGTMSEQYRIVVGTTSDHCRNNVGPLSEQCRIVVGTMSDRCRNTIGKLSEWYRDNFGLAFRLHDNRPTWKFRPGN